MSAAMIFVAVLANVWVPVARPDRSFRLDEAIPKSFGDWTVDASVIPLSPSPDVQANLDKIYDQIVSRTYRNSAGQSVMLVVAYGGEQSDSLKAHRQEVCYQAQGFAIRQVRNDAVHVDGADLPIVRVHAVKGRRSEPISYWFTMGRTVAMGRAERLAIQIGYGLAGQVPDGLLLRISNISPDAPGAYKVHDDFARALLGAVDARTRTRLAGIDPPRV